MVALPQKFATNDPALASAFPVITGLQKCVFVQSELKENSKKNGHYIELKAVVMEGEFKDAEYIERLNIINPNDTAVKIAYQTLARISEAVGMSETPDNTEQLHNKPFLAEFIVEKGQPYEKLNQATGQMETKPGNDQSRIKKYLPLGGATQTAAAPAAQANTAPAATAAAPATTTAKPSWA